MPTSIAFHRHPGRSWWFGLALAWAVCPIAARAATEAPPPAPARLAAAEAPARFGEPEEPLGPTVTKRGVRVIPIDFESATLDKETVKVISQALWTRLEAMDDLALFPATATRRWLIRNDLFPFTPYLPPPPPARITGALKADFLITGHLNRPAGVYVLDVSVYSDRERKYILKDFKIEKATEAELLEAFGALGAQLHQVMTGKAASPEAEAAPKATKAAKESAAAPAKAKPKAKSVTPTRKAPVRVHVTAKPRSGAQRPSPRKTTAPPAPQVKTSTHEGGEGEAGPGAEPTPAATKPAETPAPAESPAPTAAPGKSGGHEAAPEETPAATPEPAKATPEPAKATPAPNAATPAATSDPEHARDLLAQAGRSGISSEDRLKLLAQAARLDPANEDIQQQLAMEYYTQRDYEACIAQCDAAAIHLPKTAMLKVIKGSALFELGRYEQAVEADQEALKLDPGNVYGHFNLALALTHQNPSKAIPAWREFIATFGDNPQYKALVEQARASLAGLEPATEK